MNSLNSVQLIMLVLLGLQALSFTKLHYRAYLFATACSFVLMLSLDYTSYFSSLSPYFQFSYSATSQFFALIVTGLGLLIGIYSKFYFKTEKDLPRFYGWMGVFQWACLLIFLADHILILGLAWELTSITSFFLIGFHRESEASKRSALQAFLVTGFGGLCLIAGLILLAENLGSYSVSEWMTLGSDFDFRFPPLAIILILIGILSKSAQFPFHFWLPQAMVAPTPISAYLHSATLVKLGLFLAATLHPLLSSHPLWHVPLSGAGLLSFAFGAIFALKQKDLKAMLAFTTFSQLGLALMLLGQQDRVSFYAALVVILAHAFYKSGLFLSVGVLSSAYGSQKLARVSGLWSHSKVFSLLIFLLCFAMAGLPPSLAFFGKEFAISILHGDFASEFARYFSWTCFSLGAIATTALAARFVDHTVWGPQQSISAPLKKKLVFCILPLGLIGLLGPAFLSKLKSFASLGALEVDVPGYAIYLSAGYVVVGLIIGLALRKSNLENERSPLASKVFLWLFDCCLPKTAAVFQKHWESITFKEASLLFAGLTIAFLLPNRPDLAFRIFQDHPTMIQPVIFSSCIFLAGLIGMSLYFLRNVPLQIFVIGVVGYLVTFSFALAGAPDLVLTQLLVETASLVLMVLAFLNSKPTPHESAKNFPSLIKWLAAIALAFLAISGVFTWPSTQFLQSASQYFFDTGPHLAYGSNIVNVILVDYRALDTLGEITVLGIAFFGALALCRNLSKLPKRPAPYPGTTLWMRSLGVVFIWALAAMSIFFLLRGHHEPGGGFIGGLLLALALFLRMILFLRSNPSVLLTIAGLVLAYTTSITPLLFGLEFFQSTKTFLGPSSLFFDVGVYACVAGSVSGFFEIFLRMRRKRWEHLHV